MSILAPIEPGDDIIITSMIPSASPDQNSYLMFVDDQSEGTVYRTNHDTNTWLTAAISDLSTVIYLDDVSRITDLVVQEEITPSLIGSTYNIGLDADKHQITSVTVYNKTTAMFIDPANYKLEIVNTAPEVAIDPGVWITTGDQLTITSLVGNTLYVNGEQIRFETVDLINNTVSDLQRGVNGTGQQNYTPRYSKVYGLLSSDRMSAVQYGQTWNSYEYNTVEGDPLQISTTAAADFLRTDI